MQDKIKGLQKRYNKQVKHIKMSSSSVAIGSVWVSNENSEDKYIAVDQNTFVLMLSHVKTGELIFVYNAILNQLYTNARNLL